MTSNHRSAGRIFLIHSIRGTIMIMIVMCISANLALELHTYTQTYYTPTYTCTCLHLHAPAPAPAPAGRLPLHGFARAIGGGGSNAGAKQVSQEVPKLFIFVFS